MEKTHPYWMNKYLSDFSTSSKAHSYDEFYLIENTSTKKYIVLNHGNHYSENYKIWDMIDKQFELMEKYFNIYDNKSYSNRYRYYQPVVDLDKLDKLSEFGTFEFKDDKSVYFHITNSNKLAEVCNKMTLEYLYWCMNNKKSADFCWILPPNGHQGVYWHLS